MIEVWKDIKGYEGLYQISNIGRVKSLFKDIGVALNQPSRIMKLKLNKHGKGYFVIHLSKNSKHTDFSIHRLVAKAFINNDQNLPQVNHKDGDTRNNNVENLEWCTGLQNIRHAIENGLINLKGSANKKSKRVLQFTRSGEFLKEWESVNEIYRTHGYCRSNIKICCKGKIHYAYGSVWKFKEAA